MKCNDHFLLESILVPPSVLSRNHGALENLVTFTRFLSTNTTRLISSQMELWLKCVKHPGNVVRARAIKVELCYAVQSSLMLQRSGAECRNLQRVQWTKQEEAEVTERQAVLRSVRIGP